MPTIILNLCRIPKVEFLAARQRIRLVRGASYFKEMNGYRCDSLVEDGKCEFAHKMKLMCPLSNSYCELRPADQRRRSATKEELKCCLDLEKNLGPNFYDLKKIIDYIAFQLSLEWRRGNTFSETDREGYRVLYPSCDEIEERIFEISNLLEKHAPSQRFLASIIAFSLILILNIHPLKDGNGRLARIVFNYLMRENPNSYYLPLFEIAEMASGGLIYATRQSWINSHWDNLISFFYNSMILAYHSIVDENR